MFGAQGDVNLVLLVFKPSVLATRLPSHGNL